MGELEIWSIFLIYNSIFPAIDGVGGWVGFRGWGIVLTNKAYK